MTDRPIIFSAPMVRALLDGRKAQTRRVLKPQPPEWATFCEQPEMMNALHQWVPSGLWRWSEPEQTPRRPLRAWPVDADGEHFWARLRYAPGDRLWVREAWWTDCAFDGTAPRDLQRFAGDLQRDLPIWFAEDDKSRAWGTARPSIFMPRWASRLTLHIEEVRVQRLQEISEEDACAEGGLQLRSGRWVTAQGEQHFGLARHSARSWFSRLWGDLHGPEAWAANPWVAALTFRVEHANIDAAKAAEVAA
ncbi:hypothetical protein EOD42_13860 [Rhodovarius crocodyli]|uniref:Uncharacterized protein n=1 Tax=Rhodovarius crocodyli TaxID=1979269 RepID=A0A437MEW9_9PROT|nr:hypothetical protein [Rhodovarius crocodyli]RVT96198.1 hypothetical protein EOD42_13860 [Rhodovarius crocodyli]